MTRAIILQENQDDVPRESGGGGPRSDQELRVWRKRWNGAGTVSRGKAEVIYLLRMWPKQ